jgi:two-component system response regulator GlrR
MDKQSNLKLFDVCGGGPLYETLEATLKSTFGGRFRSQSVDGLDGRSQAGLLARLEVANPQVILLIVDNNQLSRACNFIKEVKARKQGSDVVVISEECDASEMFDLLKVGASDFMVAPISVPDTVARIWRLFGENPRHDLTQSLKATAGMKLLVGQAPSFLAETRKIPLLAGCDGRVLILGETGTGKELFARAIHYLSPRMRQPFVPVSCGAIPVDLLENELFGHEKGAFTGAISYKPGLIREAENGTLFLDEIDALPLLAQTKLLRFLQEGEYRPLGASKSLQADVRVIAASNANLGELVREGRLRQDLYYRLNIIRINLPPLRDRREDIPLLSAHFVDKYAHEFRRNIRGLTEAAMQKLVFHDWPGNIRELENTIERAVVLTHKERIEGSEIMLADSDLPVEIQSFQESKAKVITKFERSYIRNLMVVYRGNITHAARAAKKNRRAFWELMRKHKIDVNVFRSNPDAE